MEEIQQLKRELAAMEATEKEEKALKQAIKDQELKEMNLKDWVTKFNRNFMKLIENIMNYIQNYILPIDP